MSIKIVMAEDDPNISRLIEFKLRREGYDLTVCNNGRDGLEAVRQLKPELVLLDVMMPFMTGYEVLEQIKADPELKHIPVIMLTAKGQESDISKGREAGAADYIVKPFQPAELTTRLKQILGPQKTASLGVAAHAGASVAAPPPGVQRPAQPVAQPVPAAASASQPVPTLRLTSNPQGQGAMPVGAPAASPSVAPAAPPVVANAQPPSGYRGISLTPEASPLELYHAGTPIPGFQPPPAPAPQAVAAPVNTGTLGPRPIPMDQLRLKSDDSASAAQKNSSKEAPPVIFKRSVPPQNK